MRFEKLLIPRDQRLLKVAEHCYWHPTSRNLQRLAEEVGCERATLLSDLALFCEHLQQLGVDLRFQVVDHELCFSAPATSLPVSEYTFQKQLLRGSFAYQLLEMLLCRPVVDHDLLMATYGISRASIYRYVLDLNKALRPQHLRIDKLELQGKELQLRYFYYQLLEFCPSAACLAELPKLPQAQPVLQNLLQDLGLPINSENLLPLLTWSLICWRRTTHGCQVPATAKDGPALTRSPVYDQIAAAYSSLLPDAPPLSSAETDCFYQGVVTILGDRFSKSTLAPLLEAEAKANSPLYRLAAPSRSFLTRLTQLGQLEEAQLWHLRGAIYQTLFSSCYFTLSPEANNSAISVNPLFTKKIDLLIEQTLTLLQHRQPLSKENTAALTQRFHEIWLPVAQQLTPQVDVALDLSAASVAGELAQRLETDLPRSDRVSISFYPQPTEEPADLLITLAADPAPATSLEMIQLTAVGGDLFPVVTDKITEIRRRKWLRVLGES